MTSRPALADSSPAMMRRRLVLPEPEGPSRARNSPRSTARSMPSSTEPWPKCLLRPWIVTLMSDTGLGDGGETLAIAKLEQALEHERHQPQPGQQRGYGEGAHRVIFVVERLDVERHRVGGAADAAGNDR